MDDIKDVAKAIIEPILTFAVRNSKDEEEKKDDVKNEDVDKRKLIDEIGGILKDKVDDEIIRTVIKKCEEIGYDKSEAVTADNKKAKNEEDEEKEEKFEEEKEIADNKKAKNEEDEEKEEDAENEEEEKDEDEKEEKEEKEAENKCKNSMDDIRKAIYGGKSDFANNGYLTKDQRLELGNNY